MMLTYKFRACVSMFCFVFMVGESANFPASPKYPWITKSFDHREDLPWGLEYKGREISAVQPESTASRNGVKKYWHIMTINGDHVSRIATTEHVQFLLENASSLGTNVNVTFSTEQKSDFWKDISDKLKSFKNKQAKNEFGKSLKLAIRQYKRGARMLYFFVTETHKTGLSDGLVFVIHSAYETWIKANETCMKTEEEKLAFWETWKLHWSIVGTLKKGITQRLACMDARIAKNSVAKIAPVSQPKTAAVLAMEYLAEKDLKGKVVHLEKGTVQEREEDLEDKVLTATSIAQDIKNRFSRLIPTKAREIDTRREANCTCGQGLVRNVTQMYYCDKCLSNTTGETFGCRLCDYDVCRECYSNLQKMSQSADSPRPATHSVEEEVV